VPISKIASVRSKGTGANIILFSNRLFKALCCSISLLTLQIHISKTNRRFTSAAPDCRLEEHTWIPDMPGGPAGCAVWLQFSLVMLGTSHGHCRVEVEARLDSVRFNMFLVMPRPARRPPIPFVPFLCAGAAVVQITLIIVIAPPLTTAHS
jgi:hypothetical protein